MEELDIKVIMAAVAVLTTIVIRMMVLVINDGLLGFITFLFLSAGMGMGYLMDGEMMVVAIMTIVMTWVIIELACATEDG